MKMESNLPPYPCTWNGSGTCRGAALVLNYMFDGEAERKGSEFDVQRMTRILKDLGYEVSSFGNLSYEETEQELRKFKDDGIHSQDTTDSTIVCIMSHGDAGSDLSGTFFETDDGELMGSEFVIDLFDSQNAPGLKGKPKLFFFNFCRGPFPGELTEEAEELLGRAIPASKGGRDSTDTLIVFASLPRFAAFRFPSTGTVFIQALCDVLEDREQVAQKHIELLLKQVDEKVKAKLEEIKMLDDYDSQTVEKVNRGFNREFYFLSFHKLRSYYLDNVRRVKPLPWSTQFNWSVDEIYTPLVVADAHQSGESFPHEELINRLEKRFPHGSGYRCLIEGNPGYGKSTFMLKLISDWAKLSSGNYLSRFRLVLLVKLVEVGEKGDLESRIWELYSNKIDLAPESNLFESESAKRVLVLLDGYDEANENTKKSVMKIMSKELWSQCHLVLTSRFGHVTDDLKSHALCAKLEGFQDRDVAVAVGKFFINAGRVTKDEFVQMTRRISYIDPKYLLGLLSDNDKVLRIEFDPLQEFIRKLLHDTPYCDLAKCPLLCFMLCCLVTECPDSKLPESKTELYFAIINRNLCRAADRKAPPGTFIKRWNWDVLKSKFLEAHAKKLKEFGKLCLEYILNNSPHFTLFQLAGDSETCDANHPEVIRLLEAGVIVEGDSNSGFPVYHPVHRTMAEFLTAYYLTEEDDKLIVEGHFRMLFFKHTSFGTICSFVNQLVKGEMEIDKWVKGLPCRIHMQEYQNKEVAREFASDGFAVRTKDSHAYLMHRWVLTFAFENLSAASAWNELSQLLRKCLEHKKKLYVFQINDLGLTGTQNSESVAVARDECVETLKSFVGSYSGHSVMILHIKEPSVEKAEDGFQREECLLALLAGIQDPPVLSFLAEVRLDNLRRDGDALDSFVSSILKARFKRLYLSNGSLTFETSQLKNVIEVATGTGFRLNTLTLSKMQLILRDPEAFDLDPASFPLEQLRISECQFTPKLLEWLASSVRELRFLALVNIPFGICHAETEAWRLFSSNNGNTLEELCLSFSTAAEDECIEYSNYSSNKKGSSAYGNLLRSLQDIVPLYLILRSVKILGSRELTKMFEAHESLTYLQEKILELPRLRELRFPPYGNAFFHALANLAYKWSGANVTYPGYAAIDEMSLDLLDLNEDEKAQMDNVFTERQLEYRSRGHCVWFPQKAERHLSSSKRRNMYPLF